MTTHNLRINARLALILLALFLAITACTSGGGGSGGQDGSQTTPSAFDVTATYGAQQFRAQLTAIAPAGTPAP
ncbi:MAG: hypothetical protein ACKOC5_20025 [Chloroflexota bacterium]